MTSNYRINTPKMLKLIGYANYTKIKQKYYDNMFINKGKQEAIIKMILYNLYQYKTYHPNFIKAIIKYFMSLEDYEIYVLFTSYDNRLETIFQNIFIHPEHFLYYL